MMNGVQVDIVDEFSKIMLMLNLFSFVVWTHQASRSLPVFVISLGVAVEEVRKWMAHKQRTIKLGGACFSRYKIRSLMHLLSSFFQHIFRFYPDKQMEVIGHKAISKGIRQRIYVFRVFS
jgi:hypothetical protein